VEALLRWYRPEEGLISPSEFFPQLEELGLMVEVWGMGLKNGMPAKCYMAKTRTFTCSGGS